MVHITATIGIPKIAPTKPASLIPTSRANRTRSGCNRTLRPIMLGDKMFSTAICNRTNASAKNNISTRGRGVKRAYQYWHDHPYCGAEKKE